MNGTRLSLFAPVQAALGVDAESNGKVAFFFRNLAAGAACGAVGALIGSPLFLVKARLQSQSTVHSLRTPGAGEFRYVHTQGGGGCGAPSRLNVGLGTRECECVRSRIS